MHNIDTPEPTSGTAATTAAPTATTDNAAMRIDAERRSDGIVLARVSGEVDLLSAPDLRSWIQEELTTPARLVLDLDGVEFLGSAGLSVLAELVEASSGDRLTWAIVAGTRVVLRPLEATGLAEQMPLHADLDSAVEAVRT
ncbi:STAS domain-containing protein [Saccharomonospora sp. CUA-673]|uniref:STAS domain-containing protein n=1 Tax=Saccharomonospora sp. CUA-673 TaxID=1904969 RepID=UPI000B082A94